MKKSLKIKKNIFNGNFLNKKELNLYSKFYIIEKIESF